MPAWITGELGMIDKRSPRGLDRLIRTIRRTSSQTRLLVLAILVGPLEGVLRWLIDVANGEGAVRVWQQIEIHVFGVAHPLGVDWGLLVVIGVVAVCLRLARGELHIGSLARLARSKFGSRLIRLSLAVTLIAAAFILPFGADDVSDGGVTKVGLVAGNGSHGKTKRKGHVHHKARSSHGRSSQRLRGIAPREPSGSDSSPKGYTAKCKCGQSYPTPEEAPEVGIGPSEAPSETEAKEAEDETEIESGSGSENESSSSNEASQPSLEAPTSPVESSS